MISNEQQLMLSEALNTLPNMTIYKVAQALACYPEYIGSDPDYLKLRTVNAIIDELNRLQAREARLKEMESAVHCLIAMRQW